MSETPLGKIVTYPNHYSPELLVGIPRSLNRGQLKIDSQSLPFNGADIWNAYELSWLNLKGKPQMAIGRFIFSCNSENIVESKSLKLYLNSLNQEMHESSEVLARLLETDLSNVSGVNVIVELQLLQARAEVLETPDGFCLDEQDIEVSHYSKSAELLQLASSTEMFSEVVDEVLYTNLFRSNCPITNQPDWATVTICYQGKKISHVALLKYLLSYRLHNDFHENCVEAIFMDIQRCCELDSLTVEANFLRRGGLDINPVRTTQSGLRYENFPRFVRQ